MTPACCVPVLDAGCGSAKRTRGHLGAETALDSESISGNHSDSSAVEPATGFTKPTAPVKYRHSSEQRAAPRAVEASRSMLHLAVPSLEVSVF